MARLRPGVTAVIPVHPPRMKDFLPRAMTSIAWQKSPVDAVSIAVDNNREGAAVTRNRALAGVTTEWSAFLDSDDEWYEDHILRLRHHAEETGADMVYPWFEVVNGFDPWPQQEGQPFNPGLLDETNYIPVTVLVRTELIRDVGGFRAIGPPDNPCDDWGAWKALVAAGAKIVHLNRRTWVWSWHGGNSSGRPDRW